MQKYTKADRQEALRSILSRGEVGDQSHLLSRLNEMGISATQATVSRDLRQMGYVKVTLGPGKVRYESLDEAPSGELLKRLQVLFENFVTEITGTGNLLLVKTSPGNANGVASLVDRLRRPEILGTIAGDDTVLIILRDPGCCQALEAEFRALS